MRFVATFVVACLTTMAIGCSGETAAPASSPPTPTDSTTPGTAGTTVEPTAPTSPPGSVPDTALPTTTVVRPPIPTEVDASGFDDHTVSALRSTDDFRAMARDGVRQSVVKFVIPDLAQPRVRWMDSTFFSSMTSGTGFACSMGARLRVPRCSRCKAFA